MKAHLMFRDRDFPVENNRSELEKMTEDDLCMTVILKSMAKNDDVIFSSARQALNSPLQEPDEIRYRQDIFRDCIHQPVLLRELYRICTEEHEQQRRSWYLLSSEREMRTLSDSAELLNLYLHYLLELRQAAEQAEKPVQSEGLRTLFASLREELTDDYLVHAHQLLQETAGGTLISASFGGCLQGISYVLRRDNRPRHRWWMAPSYTLAEKDDAGLMDLQNRKERAVSGAAAAMRRAAEQLGLFFEALTRELAFYVGCLNLEEAVRALGLPICFPSAVPQKENSRSWDQLYDLSLALMKTKNIVGNTLSVSGKSLYLITGANQGGKTTFLRSIGQAQLMMQCGMFTAAGQFSAPVRKALFTHFKREEDHKMDSGKLDEELIRMSRMTEHLSSGCLVLFNESFSATNENEGSEINRQIVSALTESGIEVFSVTHQFRFADSFLGKPQAQYLRAQRLPDGSRTFRIEPGLPEKTAFGEDIYRKVFGKGISNF